MLRATWTLAEAETMLNSRAKVLACSNYSTRVLAEAEPPGAGAGSRTACTEPLGAGAGSAKKPGTRTEPDHGQFRKQCQRIEDIPVSMHD